MSKYTSIFLLLFCTTLSIAQIDRSQPPKSGAAPEINLKEPVRFQLNNGLEVLVVENHKLPRVSMQLTIDNPPVSQGDKAGVSSLTSSLLGKGSATIPKDDFYEEVDFLGASISIGAQSASASCLSKYFPRILELMADAALNPVFTQEEFDKEKEKLLTGLKSQEKDVSAIAKRIQLALAYGKNHPHGEITDERTVNNITLADINKYYRDYFVPANAYLVIIGDVNVEEVKELVTKNFTQWSKATPPSFSYSEPSNVQYTQVGFVDIPNAVQSEIAVQHIVDRKMKDPDYLHGLLANKILGGGGQARLFLNLREDKGYTYGAYSSLLDNKHSRTRFVASTSVRNMVTDSAVVEILSEIQKIREVPVTQEELDIAKAEYAGNFVMALENPQTIANYALNIETEDLPKDFYKTYLERLDAITIADVQKAAQKYFSADNAHIIVVGKGSDVLENLEKLSFNEKQLPLFYYDKFANAAEKPDYGAGISEGTTAKTVLQHYVDAIGGAAKLEAVTSFSMTAEAQMQGQTLEFVMKKGANKQFLQDVRMMGNSVQKQVLDGDKGYLLSMGQKKEMTPEELEKAREEALAFPELDYLASNKGALEGIENINGQDAFRIKISDNKTLFYAVDSGLKIQEMNLQEVQGQPLQTISTYSDYKEISGIKFPFKIGQAAGPMNFDFMVKEIKINEGVSDADFK